ncbi:PIN domain-containing protein [Kamptonema animale CS-326]|uniref:type II toxin-antitoxin system VapC family toxin n=1 Tax=Kamptonema animale TaxID=92934 RepID=UPI00232EF8FB|nr:PIN domain-containing protein [Kamptonema animale]MDB9509797.1 PIN domain-containing protein [Kamptonema animale CS-326]
MKILLDTNIIIDVALERQPFYSESVQLISLVYQRQVEGYISGSTFSDLYYIIRKAKGRDLTLEFVRNISTFCQVATVDRAVISMALNANFKDFEDAIQYSTAVINQLDAIITRNQKDFPVTTPRILTPAQLIQELTNYP